MSEDLKVISASISEKVSQLEEELVKNHAEKTRAIEEESEKLKIASAQGDHAENQAYTDALKNLQQYRNELGKINVQIESLSGCKGFDDYESIGLVVLGSTFKLVDDNGHEFIYKLFPENVSDLDRQILAKNTPIGEAVWLREVGDHIFTEHRETGESITYTIVDIY